MPFLMLHNLRCKPACEVTRHTPVKLFGADDYELTIGGYNFFSYIKVGAVDQPLQPPSK
jgi:hypothetical protein